MDAALNLPREMFSHGIRRMVAKEAARASFDEVGGGGVKGLAAPGAKSASQSDSASRRSATLASPTEDATPQGQVIDLAPPE